MASRTTRPRVLAAISDLGTFTVPELCQAAGLSDRNEAYTQLDRLQKQGFLGQEQLPPVGKHRPLTLYKLTSDPAKRREFAKQLSQYHLPRRSESDSGLARAALEEADRALNRVETSLAEIEGKKGGDAIEQLSALDPLFRTARTDIGTARLEYGDSVSHEKTPSHPAILADARWQEANSRREKLKALLDQRWQPQEEVIDLLRAAARIISKLVPTFPLATASEIGAIAVQKLTGELKLSADREVLVDQIRADPEHPFAPVFRHAWRTKNRELLYNVLQILSNVQAPWWKYNSENARYLMTSQLHIEDWLAAYESMLQRVRGQSTRPLVLGVYSCATVNLNREAYLHLSTEEHRISLVSPREVNFLGLSEPVRPTLLIDSMNLLESLDCTFLNPKKALYAYGPIANYLALWQGAPDLRVAAYLGMLGLPLRTKLLTITEVFKNDRSLLIIQKEGPAEAHDLVKHLSQARDVEEIALTGF